MLIYPNKILFNIVRIPRMFSQNAQNSYICTVRGQKLQQTVVLILDGKQEISTNVLIETGTLLCLTLIVFGGKSNIIVLGGGRYAPKTFLVFLLLNFLTI